MPTLAPLGFRVTRSHVADVFDNATVVIEGVGLELTVERERSVVSLAVAPAFAPGQGVDSSLLFEYLDRSDDTGFTGRELDKVLSDVAQSLPGMLPDLQAIFSKERWAQTQREIEEVKQRRAKRL